MPSRQYLWQQKRKAAGLCICCGKPRDTGKVNHCQLCAEVNQITIAISTLRRLAPDLLVPEQRTSTTRYRVPKTYKGVNAKPVRFGCGHTSPRKGDEGGS